MAAKAQLTVEEFLRLALPDGRRAELDEGALVETRLSTVLQSRVAGNVFWLLQAHAETHRLGEVFVPGAGFRLGPDTLRGPAVSFVSCTRLKDFDFESRFFDGAPDLAVEVVSPSDTAKDIQKKVTQYLAAGARAVWVVYPDTQEVHAFGADGSVRRLRVGDALEQKVVFPDLRLDVSEFFVE